MRPPASSCLFVQADHDRATAAVPTTWEAHGLEIAMVDQPESARWGSSLMGVRRTGRWSRRRDGGRCTLDLVPAGTGRTLVVMTLEPSRRRLAAPLGADVCWSALERLRAVLEAEVVSESAVRATARPRVTQPSDPLPAPTAPVASGILPA